MRYRQQFDLTDCGAACLAMIASYFGKQVSVAQVREFTKTDTEGTNLQGLVDGAATMGLSAQAVKGNSNVLTPQTPVPFIAHIELDCSRDEWSQHYVVVKKITPKYIEIWNPDPLEKKKRLNPNHFYKIWTGYAVFLKPTDNFSYEKKNSLLVRFLPLFFPHKKLLIYSFLASLLLMLFGLLTSFYYKYVYDEIIFSKSQLSLSSLSIGVMTIIIIQSIVTAIRSVFLTHLSYKVDMQLNFSYLSHILKLPINFFDSRKAGEILSRLGDLGTVKTTISNALLSGAMDLLMIMVSIPFLLNISSTLFMISTIAVIILSGIVFIFSKIYHRYYTKMMTSDAEVQSHLVESINGISTIKALNAENLVYKIYETKKVQSIKLSWKVANLTIVQNLITNLINGTSSILVFWLGSTLIIKDSFTLGTLLTFNSLLGYFTSPLFRLINMQTNLQEALVAAERVGEILELDQELKSSVSIMTQNQIQGDIEIQNLKFRYGTRQPLYEKLSLKIKQGSYVAIVGPSGCGKTTFAKLLLKFYEPEEGIIIINGYNIKDIDTQSLRSCIGYVPQDIFLFAGTVAENIALHSPESKMEEIMQAAQSSGASSFIDKLPNRYNSVLGEHGGGLSGGERQRLMLARAIMGKPKLLILDEATSNLDALSEVHINKSIGQLRESGTTVILIAHRLSTVKTCDKIFVMNDGKIVQEGRHESLVNQNGLYRTMWMEASCS